MCTSRLTLSKIKTLCLCLYNTSYVFLVLILRGQYIGHFMRHACISCERTHRPVCQKQTIHAKHITCKLYTSHMESRQNPLLYYHPLGCDMYMNRYQTDTFPFDVGPFTRQ